MATQHTDKVATLRIMRQEVLLLRDRLGRPIDKDVIETVTALRALGFNTTSSCGGHLRRMTTGPYVIVRSVKAQQYERRALEINDLHDATRRKLKERANYFRAVDMQRLTAYLVEFYLAQPLIYRRHLVIQSLPMTLNILRCHSAEFAQLLSGSRRKQLLVESRNEMNTFTRYLTKIYLTTHNTATAYDHEK
jgi:hypothetical protein